MIANITETGWEVIYHRAHALLAAEIAGEWKRTKTPVRLYETIAAISHHDDLEREWEGNQLTEAGTPLDFTLDKNTAIGKLRDLVKNARYRGRWVAMLISLHVSFLNEPKRGESAELDSFLDGLLEQQQQWRQELQLSQSEVESAYAFMQWCDQLSLILCQRALPAGGRALEISHGPDGKRYDVRQRDNSHVGVEPWPFDAEQFIVEVEACYLNQVKFTSNDELTAALQKAPIQVLEWTFEK
ncbi:MAG: DUF3891 family protein [Chroococcidiopsidaceae cyanobacterium CP_BM_RX_35]|nr:DUF3891 family protein [Chroococcidiopsidaceae cyanobacterium CP_BM_RX_35]